MKIARYVLPTLPLLAPMHPDVRLPLADQVHNDPQGASLPMLKAVTPATSQDNPMETRLIL